MEGMNKIGKMGVANIGGLQKIGGLAPLCQLCRENLKISHAPLYNHPSPPFLASHPFLVKIPNPTPNPHWGLDYKKLILILH